MAGLRIACHIDGFGPDVVSGFVGSLRSGLDLGQLGGVDPAVLPRGVGGHQPPDQRPRKADQRDDDEGRTPSEVQGEHADDGTGDRAAERAAGLVDPDGAGALLTGNQLLTTLFAVVETGPSPAPNSARRRECRS